MEDLTSILEIISSWPVAVIISVLLLRRPIINLIDRLIDSESGKARVGPIEVELGKLAKEGQRAVSKLNRINYLMAESRLLELEITEGKFGPVFSPEQRKMMRKHIDELKSLT
ncbi:hypothetical protein P3644_25080, partial [Vibrio parahaemolyticus]|nr:hypothetical protein [Vibrio parahaemolyticus]